MLQAGILRANSQKLAQTDTSFGNTSVELDAHAEAALHDSAGDSHSLVGDGGWGAALRTGQLPPEIPCQILEVDGFPSADELNRNLAMG